MLYLASKSPRRKELLQQIVNDFQLLSAPIDEVAYANESAEDFVLRMANEKAEAGLNLIDDNNAWVLGSDTVVVINGEILGKPNDESHFIEMMNLLSGQKHQVMTALALQSKTMSHSDVVITDVEFRTISAEEIKQYWLTGEPQDKAGGYGIQGLAGKFVKRINGSYSSVVGLPLCETEQWLKKAKII